MKNYKVLFCDLDGTLIETLSGETFPKGIWDMKFKLDVLEAIKKLAPIYVFIVTNQGGIEKGFVDSEHFKNKISFINDCITEYCGVDKADSLVCASNSKSNRFRKPNPGMLETFYSDYHNAYNESWFIKGNMLMIGDASGLEGRFSDSDKKTAENFGIDYMDVEDFVKGMRYERDTEEND